MIEAWHKQYQSNPKFKTNFGLFKEKFKSDKAFKEANKYFEVEKIFREECENKATGLMPGSRHLTSHNEELDRLVRESHEERRDQTELSVLAGGGEPRAGGLHRTAEGRQEAGVRRVQRQAV